MINKFTLEFVALIFLSFVGCEVSTLSDNSGGASASPTPPQETVSSAVNSTAREHFYRGLQFQSAGDYPKAIEQFKLSIEAGNDDKEMYRRVSDLYRSLKDHESEAEYLRAILEKDTDDSQANSALANVLVWDLQDYENGLKQAMFARSLDKSDVAYVMNRTIGRAYEGLGENQNAIKHYKIFLKEGPFLPDSDLYKEVKQRVLELERKPSRKEMNSSR